MADDLALGQEQDDMQQAQLVAYRDQVHGPVEDEEGSNVQDPVVGQFAQDISNRESIFVHFRGKEDPKAGNMMMPNGCLWSGWCPCKKILRILWRHEPNQYLCTNSNVRILSRCLKT